MLLYKAICIANLMDSYRTFVAVENTDDVYIFFTLQNKTPSFNKFVSHSYNL